MAINRTLIAIDPGKNGAVVIAPVDGEIIVLEKEKSSWEVIARELQKHPRAKIIIERQQSSPQQGVTSAFTTGEGYGTYRGMFMMMDAPVVVVRAKEWMKYLGIPGGMELKARKELIAEKVSPRFPNINLRGPRGGLRDGVSDALGILYWAKNHV